jgi:hypothetical protein
VQLWKGCIVQLWIMLCAAMNNALCSYQRCFVQLWIMLRAAKNAALCS